MKRSTKRKISTFVGCVLSGVTMMGPLGGDLLYEWQRKRGPVEKP